MTASGGGAREGGVDNVCWGVWWRTLGWVRILGSMEGHLVEEIVCAGPRSGR